MSGCATTPDPSAVAFNLNMWLLRYPEFGALDEDLIQNLLFPEAEMFLANGCSSIVRDGNQRLVLLNMLVAHLAALSTFASDRPVGRIANASEGSVSVSFAYSGDASDMQAWLQQTQYGATFWAATAQYRGAFFIPPPNPYPGAGGPSYGFAGGSPAIFFPFLPGGGGFGRG